MAQSGVVRQHRFFKVIKGIKGELNKIDGSARTDFIHGHLRRAEQIRIKEV